MLFLVGGRCPCPEALAPVIAQGMETGAGIRPMFLVVGLSKGPYMGYAPLHASFAPLITRFGENAFIHYENRARALKACHIVVTPAPDWPLLKPMLAAAAAARPMVAPWSRVGRLAISPDHSGLLSRDATPLAERVGDLLARGPGAWISMGAKARSFVESNYDADLVTHFLLEHIVDPLLRPRDESDTVVQFKP